MKLHKPLHPFATYLDVVLQVKKLSWVTFFALWQYKRSSWQIACLIAHQLRPGWASLGLILTCLPQFLTVKFPGLTQHRLFGVSEHCKPYKFWAAKNTTKGQLHCDASHDFQACSSKPQRDSQTWVITQSVLLDEILKIGVNLIRPWMPYWYDF